MDIFDGSLDAVLMIWDEYNLYRHWRKFYITRMAIYSCYICPEKKNSDNDGEQMNNELLRKLLMHNNDNRIHAHAL